MPFVCRVDPAQRLGTVTLDDSIHAAEFVQAMQALYGHASWEPGFSALWDGRRIRRLAIEPSDLENIAARYQEMEAKMGQGRAAFVVPRDVVYVITRLLIHRLHNQARERRIFERLDEAQAWLSSAES